MGGKVLDVMLTCTCVDCHNNPTPVMATQHAQRYNTKQHLATRIMQLLIPPTDVIAEIDDADRINHRQKSPSSLYATIIAIICLVYKVDTVVDFRLAITTTNVHTIGHINVIDVPPSEH